VTGETLWLPEVPVWSVQYVLQEFATIPPELDQVRVDDCPAVMVDGVATRLTVGVPFPFPFPAGQKPLTASEDVTSTDAVFVSVPFVQVIEYV